MKAAVMHESGGVDRYRYEDAADPVCGPNDVLVRVRAAALNHLEAWAAKMPPGATYDPPRVLGSDVAGVIEQVGTAVDWVTPGQEVMLQPGVSCGHCYLCLRGEDNLCPAYHLLGQGRPGGLAELIAVPAVNVIPKPANLGFEEAAAIPLVTVTVWHMLRQRARLQHGETVLVNAAGSGVGSTAIQVAKLFGARVIASAGSDAKLERARELGASDVINYETSDLAAEARRLTGGAGVDVVVENVGGIVLERSFAALKRDGRVVTCGATAGNDATVHVTRFFFGHNVFLGSFMGRKSELLEAIPYFADGSLRPVVDRVYPLSEIQEAVSRMLRREQFGKIVLTP